MVICKRIPYIIAAYDEIPIKELNRALRGRRMIQHSFLLKEGKWGAIGTYYDVNQNHFFIIGESDIIHKGEKWFQNGWIKPKNDNDLIEGFQFVHFPLEIDPMDENESITFWSAAHSIMGRLSGSLMVVEDTIISRWQSEDQTYTGYGCFLKIDQYVYLNRGYVLKNNHRAASWALRLEKK